MSQDFDPFDGISDDTARTRWKGPLQKTSSTGIVHKIVGVILSGIIGLAIGCGVLRLICPNHPLLEALAHVFRPAGNEVRKNPPAAEKTIHPIDQPPLPKPETKQSPVIVSKVLSAPFPPKDAAIQPAPPAANESIPIPVDPPKPVEIPQPQEIRKKIVLDLAHSETYTTLSETETGQQHEIKVDEVTGLNAAYELRPDSGILSAGQAVDIVLKDYPCLSIRLSLVRNGAAIKIAPMVDDGHIKKTPFNQSWLKRACTVARKDLDKANLLLSQAKAAIQNIENYLKSPVQKSSQLREANERQLLVLKNQLPAIEQNQKQVQSRMDELQRIAKLVEQIHGTAGIHLVLTHAAKAAGESEKL
jgi:hypothetical protein